MMKHENIEKLIQKHLDREISAEEERYLQGHLAECPSCARSYQELSGTMHSLVMLPDDWPSRGFNTRVMNALGVQKPALWKKLAPVFAGSWIVSALCLLVSPIPGYLLKESIFAGPAVMRFFDKIKLVVATAGNVLAPFAQTTFNPIHIAVGLIMSIGFIYVLNKYLHKEVICST